MIDAAAMAPPHRHPRAKHVYYHLFAANALALVSTGVATVALVLVSHDLAGADAGAVIGTALAIKMLAYVSVAPVAAAVTERLPRRATLVTLDLVRAVVAVAFPYVTEVWQIYVLIFVFQAASAAFTPTYQAIIPDLMPDEADYSYALSRSRLAYELEGVVSPMLAAGLLLVISGPGLFFGTVAGFLLSAALILRVTLPRAAHVSRGPLGRRMTLGFRVFFATRSLRGLLALNLAAAAATAMVVVNTVVLVQDYFALSDRATAVALAAFGAGAVVGALAFPRLPNAIADRTVMLIGGAIIAAGLLSGSLMTLHGALLSLWFALGLGASLAQTPAGHLLRACSRPEDRQAVYAAQFTFSNACLLVTYPLAGWLGATAGMRPTFIVFGLIAGVSTVAAIVLWPRSERIADDGTDRSLVAEPTPWDARL